MFFLHNISLGWYFSEIFWKFWSVVLEKLDRPCEECYNSQDGKFYHTYSKGQEGTQFGHMVRRDIILKHLTDGEVKGSTKISGRWGRRRDQLLDDLKEKVSYRELKKKAQDHTLRKTFFNRCFSVRFDKYKTIFVNKCTVY